MAFCLSPPIGLWTATSAHLHEPASLTGFMCVAHVDTTLSLTTSDLSTRSLALTQRAACDTVAKACMVVLVTVVWSEGPVGRQNGTLSAFSILRSFARLATDTGPRPTLVSCDPCGGWGL